MAASRRAGGLKDPALKHKLVRTGAVAGSHKNHVHGRTQREASLLAAEATPHLVWSTDADGAVEYVNRSWIEYTGLSLADSSGRGWLQAVHPEDLPRLTNLWREAVANGSAFNSDYRIRNRQGEYRWFKSRGTPLRSRTGQITNWFGGCTEIEDLVEARETLAQTCEQLERIVEDRTARLQEMVAELETFSYSIAHDMRAPLRAMQGFAEAVLEDYGEQLGPQGKDYLQRIKAAAARQDHFIRDILNYSRIVRQDFRLEPVDLDQLIPALILEYPSLQSARQRFQVRSPLGSVLAHAPSLMQCVSNLLGNALKFVAPGTEPHVSLWTERRQNSLRLWVQDNGLGIAPEHHTRIFHLFERLHAQTEYAGTGIGLAVVRKAVERMEGACGVESELGKGSRFWIELKAAR